MAFSGRKIDPPACDAVELYNPTASPADVGGWFLTDDFNTPKKYRIPPGTTIAAGDYLVFYATNSFGLDMPGNQQFQFSSHGDAVYLFSGDAATNLTGYAHGFDFGAQFNGATFGRYATSTSNEVFVSQSRPTLGATNAGPRAGPVVISEINPRWRGSSSKKYPRPPGHARGNPVTRRGRCRNQRHPTARR